MRVKHEIDITDVGLVTFYELTLAEIREWLLKATQENGDVIDAALFEEFDIHDLRLLTSLTAEQIESMTPSKLRFIYEIAQEHNKDFFGLRRRVVAMGRTLLSATSNPPSPS